MAASPDSPHTPAKEATVFIPDPFHPQAEEYAAKRFKRVIRPGQDGLCRDDCLALADGVLLRVSEFRDDSIGKAKRLRIISRNGTGCDAIGMEACREKGIRVTNMPGGNAISVAELTLTLILNLQRRVKEVDRRICSGERVPSITVLAPGLAGKTVGLIGMGDIAYHVARFLQPFGCTILAWSPNSEESRWRVVNERWPVIIEYEKVGLEEMLGRVDVLSLHCPLKADTRHLVGKKELGLMKREAILINTARGGIVDEIALAEALREGMIAGAGLDCFETEPAYGDNLGELGKMDNVICLPHLGGSTDQSTLDGCVGAVDILADYLDGKGIRNAVV